MPKNSTVIQFLIIGLTLWLTGCQPLPGFKIFTGVESDQTAPQSKFVSPRPVIQVGVDQPLPLETQHTGSDKLASVEVFVNGQPLRAEATAGQSNVFPEILATAQVLVRDHSPETALPAVKFQSSACRLLQQFGRTIQTNLLPLPYPNSRWTVCHIWTGHIPGTYDLSIVATDVQGRKGQPIVQHIEVK